MPTNQFYTAESVTEGHPDKLCDLIADSVLDECLSHDALSRVACEVLATRGQIIVAGEITSLLNLKSLPLSVRFFRKVGYDPTRYAIQCLIHKQSPDIAAGGGLFVRAAKKSSEGSVLLQLGRRGSGGHGGIRLFGNPADDASSGCSGPPADQPLTIARKNRGWCKACARMEKPRSPWSTMRMENPAAGYRCPFRPAQPGETLPMNSAGNSPTRCWPLRCRPCPG